MKTELGLRKEPSYRYEHTHCICKGYSLRPTFHIHREPVLYRVVLQLEPVQGCWYALLCLERNPNKFSSLSLKAICNSV